MIKLKINYLTCFLYNGTNSNSNGSCQKWSAKCHFITLNSILITINNVFALKVGTKIGCHFNNSMFFIKK